MTKAKKISLVLLLLLYMAAGINHFVHPATYIKLIPPYFPGAALINWVSGGAEIIAALLLIKSATRKYGAYLIIFLLVAFIPAHIYMVKTGWCIRSGYCFPEWVIWLRLFPIQFLLMYWAWTHRK